MGKELSAKTAKKVDRAIEQYQEEFRHPPVYDEVEIDEIKP